MIAIDGKTLRQSCDEKDGKAAIHTVSAWATTNRLVLGQQKVAAKSNEMTAIPQLLKLLEIEGCIVTIDAMGYQKQIAKRLSSVTLTIYLHSKTIKAIYLRMCSRFLLTLSPRILRASSMTSMKV